uniref:Uncharacterized protein n=1 Tax=Sciurus vulgaris TaxID=55149 RepID=A0A8D2AU60_SCIVU
MHLKMRRQRKLTFRISYPFFKSMWITHICLMVRQCSFSPCYFSLVFLCSKSAEFFKKKKKNKKTKNYLYLLCVFCLFSFSLYYLMLFRFLQMFL